MRLDQRENISLQFVLVSSEEVFELLLRNNVTTDVQGEVRPLGIIGFQ